jgi:hypothetical protein
MSRRNWPQPRRPELWSSETRCYLPVIAPPFPGQAIGLTASDSSPCRCRHSCLPVLAAQSAASMKFRASLVLLAPSRTAVSTSWRAAIALAAKAEQQPAELQG